MVVDLPCSEVFIRHVKDALVVFLRASKLQHTSCITNTAFEVRNCVLSLESFPQCLVDKTTRLSVVLKEFCSRYRPCFNSAEVEALCGGGWLRSVAACGGGALCRTGLRRARRVIPSSQPWKLVAHNQTSACNKVLFSKKAEQAAQAGRRLMLQLIRCPLVREAPGVHGSAGSWTSAGSCCAGGTAVPLLWCGMKKWMQKYEN